MKAWRTFKENVGFISGIVGILWWLGVTPEMVGQTIWSIGYYVVPFIMLFSGIAIGWRLNTLHANRSAKKDEKERTDALITYLKNLKFTEKVFLNYIYQNGSLDLPYEDHSDLDADDLIILVDTETLEDGARFTLKEKTRKIFDDHPEILEVVKDYCNRELGSMMP